MERLLLVKPSLEMKDKALDYKKEHVENEEDILHGSALLDRMDYETWLKLTLENWNFETVHDDWVVASTFFVVREMDSKIIGMIDIRHSLNEFLASYGGHIGYGVRPSERGKGYGRAILKLALDYAKGIGLEKVMLACNQENERSRKTILSCDGVKEKEFLHTDGKIVEVYWISL